MSVKRLQLTAAVAEAEDFERFWKRVPPEDRPAGPPTLRSLREKHGVSPHEIELCDEFGLRRRVSIAPFADLDPDTPIKIVFRSAEADREFPELEPGVLLLDDYLVAAIDEE